MIRRRCGVNFAIAFSMVWLVAFGMVVIVEVFGIAFSTSAEVSRQMEDQPTLTTRSGQTPT
jgi:hypothetical protein